MEKPTTTRVSTAQLESGVILEPGWPLCSTRHRRPESRYVPHSETFSWPRTDWPITVPYGPVVGQALCRPYGFSRSAVPERKLARPATPRNRAVAEPLDCSSSLIRPASRQLTLGVCLSRMAFQFSPLIARAEVGGSTACALSVRHLAP